MVRLKNDQSSIYTLILIGVVAIVAIFAIIGKIPFANSLSGSSLTGNAIYEDTTTLTLGESVTKKVNGVDYEITNIFMSSSGSPNVKLSVNSDINMPVLQEGGVLNKDAIEIHILSIDQQAKTITFTTNGDTSAPLAVTISNIKNSYASDELIYVTLTCTDTSSTTDISFNIKDNSGAIVKGPISGSSGTTKITSSGTYTLTAYCKTAAQTVSAVKTFTINQPVAAQTCLDSDGGKVYGVAGTITTTWLQPSGQFSLSYSDDCAGNTLTEYYCGSANQATKTTYDCATEGKTCVNGACVNSASDTQAPKVTIQDITENQNDKSTRFVDIFCSDDKQLKQGWISVDGNAESPTALSDVGSSFSAITPSLTAGSHAIVAYCADASGNKGSSTQTIVIDAICGNDVCETGETQQTCAKDCTPKSVCGNNVCESGETEQNCAQDCKSTSLVTKGVIILKEGYKNQYIYDDGTANQIDIIKSFYKNNPDNYDFIILHDQNENNRPAFNGGWFNYDIKGIKGTLEVDPIPEITKLSTRIKSAPEIPSYVGYTQDKTNQLLKDYYLLATMHEINHYYCCRAYAPVEMTSPLSHWKSNVNLFYNDNQYFDIMDSAAIWTMQNNAPTCNNSGDFSLGNKKFSDLDLYLMGIIPPDQVKPIDVYSYDPTTADIGGQGPLCVDDQKFTGTKKVTIQDIIDKNGVRVPDASQSQHNFKSAFVIVVPYGKELDDGFVDYVAEEKNLLPSLWYEASSHKSTMQVDDPSVPQIKNPTIKKASIAKTIPTPIQQTQPSESKPVPSENIPTNHTQPDAIVPEKTCAGCLLNERCISQTVRLNGQYCDSDNKLYTQKQEKISCENNFECVSNLCIDSKCTSPGMFERFTRWLSKLFG